MTDIPKTIPADLGKCALHGYHSPRPQRLHIHHVFPLAWRPDAPERTDEDIVHLCPTGHDNVHALLDLLRKFYEDHGGVPPYYKLREWGEAERDLAFEGVKRWIAATGQLPLRA